MSSRVRWVVAAIALLGAPASEGSVIVASDGTFGSDWSFSQRREGSASATAVLSQQSEGANLVLQAALYSPTTFNPKTTVWGIAEYAGFAFDPSAGTLTAVSMDIDVRAVSSAGTGQAIKIVAEQSGNLFFSPSIASGVTAGYVTRSLVSVPISSFADTLFAPSPGNVLDLSPGGAAIHFGVAIGNTNSGWRTHRYDDWQLRLEIDSPAPEPAALALFGIALMLMAIAGAVLRVRRRRARNT